MNTPSHQDFLSLAVAEAVHGVAQKGGPFGAVVVRDGRVLAKGFNRVTLDLDPTAHAEVTAIRGACRALQSFSLQGCTLYASCEPCPLCLSASYWARLDAVYFAATRHSAAAVGFDDAFFYEELAKRPEDRSLPAIRVPLAHEEQPFTAWRAKTDRIDY